MTTDELRLLGGFGKSAAAATLLWAADEIDSLNARVASLEAFARELWEHDKVNMHIEADGAFPDDYCDWCRGMVAKARELGIEE